MFKDNLKKLRIKKNISQKTLADKIFVSRSAVAKWEQGRGMPNEESIDLLCKYFKVDKKELLGVNEDNNINNIHLIKEKNRYTFGTLILLIMILIPCLVILYSVYREKNNGWTSYVGSYGSADVIGIEINKPYEISFEKIISPTPIKYDEVKINESYDNSFTINGNNIIFNKPGKYTISSSYIDNEGKKTYYVTLLHAFCYDPKDLIKINSYEDLKNISNDLSGNYILNNNIDLSEIDDFEPIGLGASFTGTFINPNKYVISNLNFTSNNNIFYNEITHIHTSFFSSFSDAYVNGIILEDINIDISGYSKMINGFTAGLAGYANNSFIENCSVNGNVIGQNNVGGLIGFSSSSTIKNCVFNGNVKEVNSRIHEETSAGGLVGGAYYSDIYNNFVVCNVTSSNIAGGLAGQIIRSSYANNTVTCNLDAPYTYKIGKTKYNE